MWSSMTPPRQAVSTAERLEVERICDDFKTGWQAGAPTRIEELLAPASGTVRALLLENLLRLECLYRLQQDRPVLAAEAQQRFAGLGVWAVEVLDHLGLGAHPAQALMLTVEGQPPLEVPPGRSFLFGRGPDVDHALTGDPRVSRQHFRIGYFPPIALLRDNGSSGGTFLNGARVQQAELHDGDQIGAGKLVLRVRRPASRAWDTTYAVISLSGATSEALSDGLLVIPGLALEERLGEGGMGVVYKARRQCDGQTVAIKTVRAAVLEDLVVARFRREMAVLERLAHPGIVRHIETGTADSRLYLVMEYVEGESAAEAIRKSGPMAPQRVLDLGCQVLDALIYAHGQRIVHRDIKPPNLLLTRQDGREVVKLTDFGLARASDDSGLSRLTTSGATGGTLGFLPPEQLGDFKNAGVPADLYSTAATLYFLLTGQHIYEPEVTQDLFFHRMRTEEPRPLGRPPAGPPVPAGLLPIFRCALARNPADRYRDARAMRDALTRAL